jgi:hypothetical protein
MRDSIHQITKTLRILSGKVWNITLWLKQAISVDGKTA